MPDDFKNRRVLITGGTGALGRAVVHTLLDRGALCHLTTSGRSESPQTPGVQLHEVDLRDEPAVVSLYAKLPDLWASIHLAGAFAGAPIAETTAQSVRDMFETNAMTCFLCCREAVKNFRLASGNSGGRIVNVGARPAVAPAGGMTAYAASKAAVASITQCLAEEVRRESILVNAVLPSIMDTPANRRSMPKADFNAWPKVEQVAQAIAFLASPLNTLTTGALLPVFGRS